jgi:hypothetical protein
MTEKKKSKSCAMRQKPAPSEASTIGTYAERYAAGKALRDACPRKVYAAWKTPAGPPGPGPVDSLFLRFNR